MERSISFPNIVENQLPILESLGENNNENVKFILISILYKHSPNSLIFRFRNDISFFPSNFFILGFGRAG